MFIKPSQQMLRVVLFLYSVSSFNIRFLGASDTLTQTQSISDGETLVSSGEIFELGFFSPDNSSNRYVGIWYKKIPVLTVVWVANRENWLTDSSGQFLINAKGDLVVLDGVQNTLWSTNTSVLPINSSARLLDSGNLVLRVGNFDDLGRVLWQSFDYPSDTFVPTMELGVDLKTGRKTTLTSWKSSSDPSFGSFHVYMDIQNLPQGIISNGSVQYWRTGPWDGLAFSGIEGMDSVYVYGFNFVRDNQQGRTYLTYDFDDPVARIVVDWQGKLQQYHWDEDKMQWVLLWFEPADECDVYGKCGPFGSCNPLKSPICTCWRGFEPKYSEDWSKGNWAGGCVRRKQLNCSESGKEDGFWKAEGVKLPDYPNWVPVPDENECNAECLKNCSCQAYGYDSGIGCMHWNGDLIDMQEFSSRGKTLYIRLPHSELS